MKNQKSNSIFSSLGEAISSFGKALGSLLNIYPATDYSQYYNKNPNSELKYFEQDMNAIHSDFQKVGDDMRKVMNQMDYEIKNKKRP